MSDKIDFGWFTLCFDVEDLQKAIDFYDRSGFQVEGVQLKRGMLQYPMEHSISPFSQITSFSNGSESVTCLTSEAEM
jgi:hypothetical protein